METGSAESFKDLAWLFGDLKVNEHNVIDGSIRIRVEGLKADLMEHVRVY